MIARRALVAVLALAWPTSACSAVPNMDAGSAGCQNARGIGHAAELAGGGDNMAVAPQLHGLTPAEAAERGRAAGHTVVFNVEGSCWCVPPPDGEVSASWFGQHGALWLMVDGAEKPEAEAPFAGWGC